jgi:hypothetical protein
MIYSNPHGEKVEERENSNPTFLISNEKFISISMRMCMKFVSHNLAIGYLKERQ